MRRGRKLTLSKSPDQKDPAKKATDVISAVPPPAEPAEEKPKDPANRPRAVLDAPPVTVERKEEPERAVPVAEEVPEELPEEKPGEPLASRRKTAEEMADEEAALREEAQGLSARVAALEMEIRLAGEDVSRTKQELRTLKEELTSRVGGAVSVIVGVNQKTEEPVKLVFRNKEGENILESHIVPSFKRKYVMLRAAEKDLKEQEEAATAARQDQQQMLGKAEQLRLRREMREQDEELKKKSRELKERITESSEETSDASEEAKEALEKFTKLGIEVGKKHAGAKKIDVGKGQELLLKNDDGQVVKTIKMPAKMARRWEQYQRANKDASAIKKDTEVIRLERKSVVEERLAMRQKVRSAGAVPRSPES
jgi:hypothetical protein